MKCNEIEFLLSPYLDNELPQEETLLIGTHLNNCDQCNKLLAELKLDLQNLNTTLEPFEHDLNQVIDRFLFKKSYYPQEKSISYPWFIHLLMGATCGILLTITTFVFVFPNKTEKQIEDLNQKIVQQVNSYDSLKQEYDNLATSSSRKTQFIAVLTEEYDKKIIELTQKIDHQIGLYSKLQTEYDLLAVHVADLKQGGIGRINLLIGNMEVYKQNMDKWETAPIGTIITKNTKIRTTAGCKAEIELSNSNTVRMNELTEIVLNNNNEFTIESGEVWTKVSNNSGLGQHTTIPVPNNIYTGHGIITVTGTEINIEVTKEWTTLAVIEGKASMANTNGKSKDLGKGKACRMNNETVDIPVYLSTIEKGTKWMLDIMMAKGRDNPEIRKQILKWLSMMGETKVEFLAEEQIKSYGTACVIPIAQYIKSEDCLNKPAAREKAIKILSDIGDWYAVEAFILLLADESSHLRTLAAKGLERVTGTNLNYTIEFWEKGTDTKPALDKWRSWWDKNKQGKISEDLDIQIEKVNKKFK